MGRKQPPRQRAQKNAARAAQSAHRADQSSHRHFALSRDCTPDAALWAIDEAMQAGKRAGRALLAGNVLASMAALNQVMQATRAAGDSLQTFLQTESVRR
jgi:ABC-type transport system involved in cytochrome c biogenesis ATPase subunit